MGYNELVELTNGINFSKIESGEYTTGSGWTNARWSTQNGLITFIRNCLNYRAVINVVERTGFNEYTRHTFDITNGVVTKTN